MSAAGLPTPGSRLPVAPVSILIVGYKAYDELDRCLTSIERHEPGADVIVIDHDADEARARPVAAAHPTVRWVSRRENPGFAAGVNLAARQASAPLLLVLNPDVELRTPIVDVLAACLTRHPQAGLVAPRMLEADGSYQATARAFPGWSTALSGRTSWLSRRLPGNPLTRRNLVAQEATTALAVDWVAGACVLIRRDVFEALNGFDERFFLYWEDADFCRRALDAGWETFYEPSVEVVHPAARASRHAPVRSLVAFHVSVFRYYWKHGGLVARLLSPVVLLGLAARFLIRLPGTIASDRRS